MTACILSGRIVMCIVQDKQKVPCTHMSFAQLDALRRCFPILFAGMQVSIFAVIEEVRVAHICMSVFCMQLAHRLYTWITGKHGRCVAQAGAPTCSGLASVERCNRAGLLWRLPVGAVVSTRCSCREGRCCLFLEGPELHMRCAPSTWTAYVGSTGLSQGFRVLNEEHSS